MDKHQINRVMKKIIIIILIPVLFFLSGKLSAQIQYENTTTTGNTSSAIGKNTVSKGLTSFASGFGSQATESYTTALGFYTFATYNKATAIGSTVKATGYQSIVLGSGDYNTGTYLINNIPRSLMIGFHSLYPTLFVVGDDTPNGFNKTGRIGIGNVTNPQAKLHIKADEGEDASLFLEPTIWNDVSKPEIMMGDTLHGISAEVDNGMIYQTKENHVFTGGNIYIKDINKGVIMKSPDGKCWMGTLDNDGVLHFSVMEACPGEVTAIRENKNSDTGNELKVYPNPTHTFLTVDLQNDKNRLLTVKLLNEKGVEVKMTKTTGTTTQFYTGDLASGTYVVQVMSGNKMLVKKVVKQ